MHYEIGDIIFWKSIPSNKSKWYNKLFNKLQHIFDGKASHVEIVIEYHPISKTVKTLGANSDGVKVRTWSVEDKKIAIGRLKGGIDQKKAKYILSILQIKYLNTEYSYKGLLNASLNAIIEKIIPKRWRKRNLVKEESKFFCSELVGTFFELCCGKKLSRKYEKNINNDVLTPSDIYESEDIIIIKDFE